jgi:head-tail adaptor
MRAGQLTQRVEWLRRTIESNKYNEQREVYTPMGELRADVSPSNGNIALEYERETSTQTLQMSVRHYNDMRITDRIKWNNSLWEVVNVIPDNKIMRKVLTLKLVEDEI